MALRSVISMLQKLQLYVDNTIFYRPANQASSRNNVNIATAHNQSSSYLDAQKRC